MDKLPIKFAVLKSFIDEKIQSVNEVYDKLKIDYESEKQFTKKNILEHILSLNANGLIEEVDMKLDKNENLIIYYHINDEGKSIVKKYSKK